MLIRIHPNMKGTVYCAAIAFGGVQEWDFAWKMFQSAVVASEASRLRSAMACTKLPWLLNRCVGHSDFSACARCFEVYDPSLLSRGPFLCILHFL